MAGGSKNRDWSSVELHDTAVDAVTVGDLAAFLRFRFPSADLLDVAASQYPAPFRHANRAATVWPGVWSETAHGWREGPHPYLDLGPGFVRVRRTDEARLERSRDREADRRRRLVDEAVSRARDGLEPVEVKPSRFVTAWSAKSRARMVLKLLSLDLSEYVTGEVLPVMVTLTAPGDWQAVFPDAATAARKFASLRRAYEHRWGDARWVWKREFQRRGAPHWHLWMVPPTSDLGEFREWLSSTWTRILSPSRDAAYGRHVPDVKACGCSEWCRSLGAGTNVSQSEGMRARDPKRLAVYFLKESLGGEGKAYQNNAPRVWAGQSVGRFWGVVGLRESVASVALDPVDADRIWRVMRRVRESKRVTVERTVVRTKFPHPPFCGYCARKGRTLGKACPSRIMRDHYGPAPDRTPVVEKRRVRRRGRSKGAAGWVAVNDGSSFGMQLAQLVTGAP